MPETIRPKQPIRRFDVFAEYNKLKALQAGRPLDMAKGYGLWLAKVVAARRFGRLAPAKPPEERERPEGPREEGEGDRFHSLNGIPQTDELFDREIVARMGEDFYATVFAPAIAAHFARGERYEAIRDAVRQSWKP